MTTFENFFALGRRNGNKCLEELKLIFVWPGGYSALYMQVFHGPLPVAPCTIPALLPSRESKFLEKVPDL